MGVCITVTTGPCLAPQAQVLLVTDSLVPAGLVPREKLSTLVESLRPTGPVARRRLASLSTGFALVSLGALVTALYVSRIADGGRFGQF